MGCLSCLWDFSSVMLTGWDAGSMLSESPSLAREEAGALYGRTPASYDQRSPKWWHMTLQISCVDSENSKGDTISYLYTHAYTSNLSKKDQDQNLGV